MKFNLRQAQLSSTRLNVIEELLYPTKNQPYRLFWHGIVLCLLLCHSATAQATGLIGGQDGSSNTYAAYVDLSLNAAPISFPSADPAAVIVSAALNSLGIGLVGGTDLNDAAYAAFVSTSSLSGISIGGLPIATSQISSVDINEYGQGILGGMDNNPAAFAALVDPLTNSASPFVNLPTSPGSAINSVAINNCGQGLIGGQDGQAYAAFVDLETQAASSIPGLPPSIEIHSVALNVFSQGLIGGDDNSSVPYAAYVQEGAAFPIATGNAELIASVAINDSGQGLVGGTGATGAYAAFTNFYNLSSFVVGNLNLSQGSILSVAINDTGLGIIGGYGDNNEALAAYIDPNTFTASFISGLPTSASSVINTVSINEFGQALVGGYDENNIAYAAYVDPVTRTAQLIANLPSMAFSVIQSAAIKSWPAIPTQSLTGNNLIFANYINQHARQAVFYLLPSICSGNLDQALQSASPLRNSISLFAADNNLFSLNHGLSLHLRNYHRFKHQSQLKKPTELSSIENAQTNFISANELAAGCVESSRLLHQLSNRQRPILAETKADAASEEDSNANASLALTHLPSAKIKNPYTLWFEAIGSFAFQKTQDQTVGFDPKTGGFIFAFDKSASEHTLIGGGMAYTFTHIAEDGAQGHSDINQEYFFLYTSWEDFGMYIDGALWASIFQTHQVRDIRLTSYDFKSISHPTGFQLTPHFELGYNKQKPFYATTDFEFLINPFTMIDWANNWQNSYQEKGNSPFNAEQKAQYSSFLRTEMGIRFYETFFFEKWIFSLEEKAGYVNKTPFSLGKVNALLIGAPGSFTVESFTSSQNLGIMEILLAFIPINQSYPYGSLSYQAELTESFQSHEIIAEISWRF